MKPEHLTAILAAEDVQSGRSLGLNSMRTLTAVAVDADRIPSRAIRNERRIVSRWTENVKE